MVLPRRRALRTSPPEGEFGVGADDLERQEQHETATAGRLSIHEPPTARTEMTAVSIRIPMQLEPPTGEYSKATRRDLR